jgi:hypothetical protein
VVIVTKTYVEQQADTPAASVAKELLRRCTKGLAFGESRGRDRQAQRTANAPKTDLEKRGVEQMNAGKAYFEEIGEKDGKPVLRVCV